MRRLLRFPLVRRLGRFAETVAWGGRRRERLLLALLGQHYRSIFRRQWNLDQPPHFYDHRHNAFALLAGRGDPFAYSRGFFAAELIRPGDKVLDVGCGDGFFSSRFLAPRAAHVDAIDIETDAITHASEHNDAPNIAYAQLDAVSDPFPSEKYDVVVLDSSLGNFAPDTTRQLLSRVAAAVDADGAFVGSEVLGVEGHDHLVGHSPVRGLGCGTIGPRPELIVADPPGSSAIGKVLRAALSILPPSTASYLQRTLFPIPVLGRGLRAITASAAKGEGVTAAEGRTRSDPSEPPVLLVEVHEMVGPSFAEHFEGMLRPLGYGATSLTGGPMPMSNERFHVLLQPKQST